MYTSFSSIQLRFINFSPLDGSPKPVMYMLDEPYTYGCEFYGSVPMPGLTPMTDKAYLSMSQALAANTGAMLSGHNSCGKTETVKVRIKVYCNEGCRKGLL